MVNVVMQIPKMFLTALIVFLFLMLLSYSAMFDISDDRVRAINYQHRVINYLDGATTSEFKDFGKVFSADETKTLAIKVTQKQSGVESYFNEDLFRNMKGSYLVIDNAQYYNSTRFVTLDKQIVPIDVEIIVIS